MRARIGAAVLVSAVSAACSGPEAGEPAARAPQALETGWVDQGPLAKGRSYLQPVVLPNGTVIVTGGSWGGDVDTEIFDPQSGAWSAAAPMSAAREAHAAIGLSSGKLLVAGGIDAPTSAEIYDPITDSWSSAGSMSFGRYVFQLTLLLDGRVLATGGKGGGDSAEIYSEQTNSWTLAAPMPSDRRHHVQVGLTDGRVLIAGGESGPNAVTTADIYDPVSNSWSNTSPMSTPRVNATATRLADGRVLVVGGSLTASAELYDPKTGAWTTTVTNVARTAPTATQVFDYVLVAGGDTSGTTVESFDIASESWSFGPSMNHPRNGQGGVRLGAAEVLVMGGHFGQSKLSTTELYTALETDAGADSGPDADAMKDAESDDAASDSRAAPPVDAALDSGGPASDGATSNVPDAAQTSSESDDGCSCRVAGQRSGSGALLALLALVLIRRRRSSARAA